MTVVRPGLNVALKYAGSGLLAVTVAGAAISSRASDWRPLWLFLTLAVLGVLGDRVHARTGLMRLSAGLTIVGLAMALLGPAPAVTICFISRILDALISDGIRLRGRRLALVWNLGMYSGVLVGSLIIRAATGHPPHGGAGFALIVVAGVTVANVINFLLAAVWIRAHGGPSLLTQFRRSFLPALPWIAAPNFLAGALAPLYPLARPTPPLLAPGLLHDLGKFAFPDRILLAAEGLDEEDYKIVREHPVHGAQLVRRVQGLEKIADIILAHHERIDGLGYPFGIAGTEIPALARMISVADVYDVMTARDTYRDPVSMADAVDELRRVAGTQLDAHYVELFISVLEREQIGFAHTADDDFEAELALEERIRELAQPRVAA